MLKTFFHEGQKNLFGREAPFVPTLVLLLHVTFMDSVHLYDFAVDKIAS